MLHIFFHCVLFGSLLCRASRADRSREAVMSSALSLQSSPLIAIDRRQHPILLSEMLAQATCVVVSEASITASKLMFDVLLLDLAG